MTNDTEILSPEDFADDKWEGIPFLLWADHNQRELTNEAFGEFDDFYVGTWESFDGYFQYVLAKAEYLDSEEDDWQMQLDDPEKYRTFRVPDNHYFIQVPGRIYVFSNEHNWYWHLNR
jgi:hypothetical protein